MRGRANMILFFEDILYTHKDKEKDRKTERMKTLYHIFKRIDLIRAGAYALKGRNPNYFDLVS